MAGPYAVRFAPLAWRTRPACPCASTAAGRDIKMRTRLMYDIFPGRSIYWIAAFATGGIAAAAALVIGGVGCGIWWAVHHIVIV